MTSRSGGKKGLHHFEKEESEYHRERTRSGRRGSRFLRKAVPAVTRGRKGRAMLRGGEVRVERNRVATLKEKTLFQAPTGENDTYREKKKGPMLRFIKSEDREYATAIPGKKKNDYLLTVA